MSKKLIAKRFAEDIIEDAHPAKRIKLEGGEFVRIAVSIEAGGYGLNTMKEETRRSVSKPTKAVRFVPKYAKVKAGGPLPAKTSGSVPQVTGGSGLKPSKVTNVKAGGSVATLEKTFNEAAGGSGSKSSTVKSSGFVPPVTNIKAGGSGSKISKIDTSMFLPRVANIKAGRSIAKATIANLEKAIMEAAGGYGLRPPKLSGSVPQVTNIIAGGSGLKPSKVEPMGSAPRAMNIKAEGSGPSKASGSVPRAMNIKASESAITLEKAIKEAAAGGSGSKPSKVEACGSAPQVTNIKAEGSAATAAALAEQRENLFEHFKTIISQFGIVDIVVVDDLYAEFTMNDDKILEISRKKYDSIFSYHPSMARTFCPNENEQSPSHRQKRIANNISSARSRRKAKIQAVVAELNAFMIQREKEEVIERFVKRRHYLHTLVALADQIREDMANLSKEGLFLGLFLA